ncbi:MAG: fibronectin type III domain-containing protein [Acidobacteriota bacterium]|nr:fibronectin type III domain-containing protein [Acidobacteriota bacterium]
MTSQLPVEMKVTVNRIAFLRSLIVAVAGVFLAGVPFASGQGIVNVAASGVTNSSAVISWTTDIASSSLVNYGVTASYGSSSVINQAPVTAHSVTLNGLNANTLYNFAVSSGSATSANFRFATLSTSPIIGDLNVIYITSDSATVNWTTDQPATTMVNYGTTTNYTLSSAFSPTLTIAHTVTLSGLAANTTYNFATISAAGSGVSSISGNQTFTTPAASATAPNASYLSVTGITNTSATITWSTDMPANTGVAYGPTTALGQFAPVQTALSALHQVTLTGLDPGTIYDFVIESTGANGATGYLYMSHFTTLDPPPVAPLISNVTSTTATSTSATITWTTDVPSNSLVNYGTTISFGFSALDSSLTKAHSVTLTGLSPGTRYDFQVVSASPAGVTTFGVNLTGFTIWAWGDSQTQGGKDGSAINYPNTLANALGVPVINEGVGGNTSPQIAQRMLATPASLGPGNCNVFWAGSNNPTQVSQILSDDASMVNALAAPSCYLVLGDVNFVTTPIGTTIYQDVIATSASLAAAYPNNYLDIRELAVQAYNPSLPLDVADHANDVMPSSLRAVVAFGSITSGALDSVSCTFSVSSGTQGVGTVVIIDSETIMINAVSGNQITGCTRGYNLTATASHAANATYSVIDTIHLGYPGLQFVASQVAGWFQSHSWPLCAGTGMICPFQSNFTTTTGTSTPGPVISSIAVSSISSTSAVITWSTDQPSTSLVNFGTTTGYGSSSGLIASLVTAHSVTLTGLTAGTPYNFDVISANSSAVSSVSGNVTFTTTSVTSKPPVISNVATTNVSQTAATVTWTTDQPSSSQVDYGTTTGYGSSSGLMATLVTTHSVTLAGLTAGTTYNFDVTSANAASQSTTSPNATVTTAVVTATPPYVGYVVAWGINDTSATITWSTDVPANARLAYGTTTALGQLSPLQAALTGSHGVILTGLNPSTTYYFVAQSTSANGAIGYSPVMTFNTTAPAPVFSPAISNVLASGISNTTATITWTTDQPSTSQVNFGTTTGFGSASPLNPTLMTSHTVTLIGLTAGTTYDFDVVSANSSAVSTVSSNSTFTTASGVTWTKVAIEGQTVFLPAGTTYRFGIGSSYLAPVTTTADETLYVYFTTFGGDPAYGVVKELDVVGNGAGVLVNGAPFLTTPSVTWTKVAVEGESVFLPAGTTYRFGIDTRYLPSTTITANGTLYVSDTTFGGDPAYGVVKELDVEGNGAGVIVNGVPFIPSS